MKTFLVPLSSQNVIFVVSANICYTVKPTIITKMYMSFAHAKITYAKILFSITFTS